jgi:hypothetical protein
MRILKLVLTLAALNLLSGCAAFGPPPKPITPQEVVQMAKDGLSSEAIIQKLRESSTVYQLSASDLVKLSKEGVPSEVLDYMQNTYLAAVRDDEARRAMYYRWGPYGPPSPVYWRYYPYRLGLVISASRRSGEFARRPVQDSEGRSCRRCARAARMVCAEVSPGVIARHRLEQIDGETMTVLGKAAASGVQVEGAVRRDGQVETDFP